MKSRIFVIVALIGGLCATATAAEFPAERAIADARLDRIRGGFDFGDNLRASFALQRTVLINGMETMRTTINVPDIANITREQATALQDALRTTVVTNGAGAVAGSVPVTVGDTSPPATNAPDASTPSSAAQAPAFTATLPASTSPGLIVQNSLDNQAISATTTIDTSVNTAHMLESMRVAESVHDAVIQFRGN